MRTHLKAAGNGVKVAARKTSQEVQYAFREMSDKLEAMFKEEDTKD